MPEPVLRRRHSSHRAKPCSVRRAARVPQRAMLRVKVAVAIADSARTHIYEVAAACRAAGLAHTATLSEVGLLMGSVLAGDLVRLRHVPGVLTVELERRLQLRQLESVRGAGPGSTQTEGERVALLRQAAPVLDLE